MKRITKLTSYLEKVTSFADVGCDHGLCSEYMLKNKLCEKAIITDISLPSLQKAERRLKKYIECGVCSSECCFGLEKVPKDTDLVLIAGMGGEEILSILKEGFLPKRFVFQPMKNVEKLRAYLLENNAHIECDELFFSGKKYYFVLKGNFLEERSTYSKANMRYGLALNSEDMRRYLSGELKNRVDSLPYLSEITKPIIEREIEFIKGILSGEIS